MTPITFNQNSWHVWLVDHFSPTYATCCRDICSYIKWFVFSVVVFLVIAAFCCGYLYGAIYNLEVLFGHVQWVGDEAVKKGATVPFGQIWASIFDVVTGVVLVVGSIIWAAWLGSKIRLKNANFPPKPPKPPGFLKIAYRSLKDKVCFTVEFK